MARSDRPSRVVVPLTAAVLVAACVVLFLYLRGRPDHTEGPREAPAARELDLGGGPSGAGNSVPVLSSPAALQEVTLVFVVPVNPGALYEVEVQGPDEQPLIRYERGPLPLDDQGGARVSIPTSHFEKPGAYRLLVREFSPDGGVREYRYPFRVTLPTSG